MSSNRKTKFSLGAGASGTVSETDGMKASAARLGGLAGWLVGWLLGRLRSTAKPTPRLRLVERITLGPRQTLSLVEAEGRRVLVATSPEGAPAFYSIDGWMGVKFGRMTAPARLRNSMRASW